MNIHKRPPIRRVRFEQGLTVERTTKTTQSWTIRKTKFQRTIKGGLLGGFKHFQLYLATCCNHCYVYLVKNGLHWFERIVWLILIALANYATIYVAWQSIDRYLTKNAFMVIDRDYLRWNTTVPSLTICPMDRLDRELFDAYSQSHQVVAERRETLWNFLEHLANSTYINFEDIPNDSSLDDILQQIHLTPNRYMEVIYNLTRDNRTNTIRKYRIRCTKGEIPMRTRLVLTEHGLCYTTNTLLDRKYSSQYALFGSLPEPTIHETQNDTLDVLMGAFSAPQALYDFIGFGRAKEVYLHSAYEVMKVDNGFGYSEYHYKFKAENIEIATQKTLERDATVRQRNCRFGHESNLTHFPIYTKNLCIQECRLRLVYEVCKCIPHFYPNRVNKPKRVCDYHTLKRCFPPNKDYFLKLYRQRGDSQEIDTAPCYCDQNCRDSVVSATHQVDTSEYIHGNGATMTMTEWPSLQYRREVYLTFTDLLVYIGGTAGLFIGFNVLGAIEIVYFFTMRLLFKLLGYKL